MAQPDRPAHRSGQRAHRGADRSAARAAPASRRADDRRRRATRSTRIQFSTAADPAADRHHAAHRVSAALDGRPLDAPRHRRLRADRDDGAARDRGRSARERSSGRSTKSTGRRSKTARSRPGQGDPGAGRAPARRARGGAPGRPAARWAASRSIGPTRRSRPTASDYAAGTFVIPMTQVFARYAKDLLEKQTYPEVRRGADDAARAAVRRHRLVARACCSASTSTSSRRRCRPSCS